MEESYMLKWTFASWTFWQGGLPWALVRLVIRRREEALARQASALRSPDTADF
jgi:hypothetical protein